MPRKRTGGDTNRRARLLRVGLEREGWDIPQDDPWSCLYPPKKPCPACSWPIELGKTMCEECVSGDD